MKNAKLSILYTCIVEGNYWLTLEFKFESPCFHELQK